MRIEVAEHAGFCFGVQRAVDRVYQLAEEQKGHICTLGPIIHNEEVVHDLEENFLEILFICNIIKSGSVKALRRLILDSFYTGCIE